MSKTLGRTGEKSRDAEAIRDSILDAARARFRRYGLNKTTMAEIAADCGMSAANLYRYFASKSAIAAVGAEQWLSQVEQHLRHAISQPGLSARDRLKSLTHERIAQLDALIAQHSHLDELIGDICAARPDLTDRHKERIQKMITDIVEEGVRRGEFRPLDSTKTVSAICWATACFGTPDTVRTFGRVALEQASDGVIDLIVDGLAPSPEFEKMRNI